VVDCECEVLTGVLMGIVVLLLLYKLLFKQARTTVCSRRRNHARNWLQEVVIIFLR